MKTQMMHRHGEIIRTEMTLKPQRLNRGDTIAVVSPSGPVTESEQAAFTAGIKFFQDRGFRVVFSPNALANSLGYSASAQEKASDINEHFANPEVKMIVASQGGSNANACLPFLDYERIKKNPKILVGISDITTLLTAIFRKTDLVVFHGNDIIWGFGRNPALYEIDEFFDCLEHARVGSIRKNLPWKTVRAGTAEGILVGGNLSCLLKLAGTKFFPDFEGAILFLEAFGETAPPAVLSGQFHQLNQLGVFANIKGLWLGNYTHSSGIDIQDIAREVTEDYDFPIVKCDDFGHNTPNTIIPIGVKSSMNAGATCEITLLEPCVK